MPKKGGLIKGKFNGCPKGIGLGDSFRNFLWKRKNNRLF